MSSKWLASTHPSTHNSGFTLVEMMVVVAIIGILSSIAIPQYGTMTARARQAEAKIGLAGIYTAEQSFSADTGSYSLCLQEIGYEPSSGTNRYYLVGFWNGLENGNCGPTGDQSCYSYNFSPHQTCFCGSGSGFAWGGSLRNDCTYDNNVSANPNAGWLIETWTVSSANQFLAGAMGSISSSAGIDAWTIDQGKNIVNIQSGL